jgi:hypothetical protein
MATQMSKERLREKIATLEAEKKELTRRLEASSAWSWMLEKETPLGGAQGANGGAAYVPAYGDVTELNTGKPTDIACVGGIHLYAEPIRAGGEVIGAINIGYGAVPQDDRFLARLAERFI